MRNDRLGGSGAVARERGDVTAGDVQESMYLAEGMMKSTGAGPAIRTAEDRFVAMFGDNPLQFRGGNIERLIPGQLDELVATT